jgi:TatD DNase family protein
MIHLYRFIRKADSLMIFETHAHYDDEAFNDDRDKLLESMYENGIEYIVNVGASLESTRQSIELAHKYPFVYAAAGVHPNETSQLNEENFIWLKEQCLDEKVVAVGEIGLDYYWDEPEHDIQKKWFMRQIELAKEIKKPVIIHSRDAAKETYDIIVSQNAAEVGGVIHCYSYSPEMAADYVKMGFYIGIGGVVTFKNGKKLKEVVEAVPMENLVLETDSPYLSPEPNRGKRNSSLNLTYVAARIAEIKGLTYDEVVSITAQNAKRLYKMEV